MLIKNNGCFRLSNLSFFSCKPLISWQLRPLRVTFPRITRLVRGGSFAQAHIFWMQSLYSFHFESPISVNSKLLMTEFTRWLALGFPQVWTHSSLQQACFFSSSPCSRLEKGMATHSSILAWKIQWTEDPGRLQSMGRKDSDTAEQLHFTSWSRLAAWGTMMTQRTHVKEVSGVERHHLIQMETVKKC